MKVNKIEQMFESLDLFYASKHLHDKIKKEEKEKEDFEEIFKKEVDKLKQR